MNTTPYALPNPLPLGALVDLLEADADRRRTRALRGEPWGPITGFPVLDEEIGGSLEPGLHVFHGGPGTGKTALALQIATQCGCPSLVVSAEMLPIELMRRLAARKSGTFLNKFKDGTLSSNAIAEKAREAVDAYPLLRILDATREGQTVEDVRNAAVLAKGKSDRLLIVVDSLNSWAEGAAEAVKERQAAADDEARRENPGYRSPGASREATEYELLNWSISALRKLAAEMDCPIIAIAERSKAEMNSDDMGAAAGTRKFMYSAETVAGMSTEKNGERIKPVIVTLAKNRHGAGYARSLFYFDGATQTFTESSRDELRTYMDRQKEAEKVKAAKR